MIRAPTGNLTRAGAPVRRTAAEPPEIEVFDFLSFDHVHLPFNEGYLRILRTAYPDDRISFCAAKGHVERLAPRVADLADITFHPARPSRRYLVCPTIIPLLASGGRASASK